MMGCGCKEKAAKKVQQVSEKEKARQLARIREERKTRLKTVKSA